MIALTAQQHSHMHDLRFHHGHHPLPSSASIEDTSSFKKYCETIQTTCSDLSFNQHVDCVTVYAKG